MPIKKRSLYLCPSVLNLFNALVVKSLLDKAPGDLVLEDTVATSELINRLQQYMFFENIYPVYMKNGLDEIKNIPDKAQRTERFRELDRIFQFPKLVHQYTDLYIHLDSYSAKLFYYTLVSHQKTPIDIHIVDEGTSSYAMDLSNTKNDFIDHDFWGEESKFVKNLKDMFLYRPSLYVGGAEALQLHTIPSVSTLSPTQKDAIASVFGKPDPIQEKVIYFEGTFFGDGYLTNEMDLFLEVAKTVGKENIVVKRHPRNAIDRFTPLGYKVLINQFIPWEVMLMNLDVTDKLLVSVASFTCLSPLHMYDMPARSILLEDMMVGQVGFLQTPGFKNFFSLAYKTFNADKMYSWRPTGSRELQRILHMLECELGGWRT